MRKLALTMFLASFSSWCLAASDPHVALDKVYINLSDKASLQRGAQLFVNFCLSCHSAAYMRYNRMAADLGIDDRTLQKNLLFAGDKVGDLMTTTMPKESAKEWFGVVPPDLTLIARVQKPDWIYTYLRSFYLDEESPGGWNNTLFPNVAMPHILYELQGSQRLVATDPESGRPQFELIKPGKLSPQEYDAAMRDLTNFLVYLGEPIKLHRETIGVYVVLFLLVLFALAYFLKKEYWKDIH